MSSFVSIVRRSWRWVAAGLAAILVMLAIAPYLCQYNPLRDWLLGRVFRDVNGSVQSSGASFGWFSPPSIYHLEIADPQARPVVTLPAIHGDRSLWQLVTDSHSLGTFRFEKPHLHLVLDEDGTNLAQVFERMAAPEAPQDPAVQAGLQRRVRRSAVGLEIRNARVSIQHVAAAEQWEAGAINLAARLVPESPDGTPARVEVDGGTLLDRTTLTRGLCDDVLKYIAPILAEAVEPQGEVSMELEPWKIPLDHPEQSTGSGRLSLHNVEVGPGPLIRELAAVLGIGDSVQLADEAVVEFRLQDGRVYHEGMEFGLPGYRIRTSGSVGLDQSLDLVAVVPMPLPRDLPDDRPLLRALSTQSLRFPIAGTLEDPALNAQVFSRSILDLVRGTLDRMGDNGTPDEDGSPNEQEPADGDTANDPSVDELLDLTTDLIQQLPIGEGQLLDRLQEREPLLRRRREESPAADPPDAARPFRDRLFPRRSPPREF